MASETENLKLIKPDPTDFYNIAQQNENMDRIDALLAHHAKRHGRNGADAISPDDIDAAQRVHAHDASEVNTGIVSEQILPDYLKRNNLFSPETAALFGLAQPERLDEVMRMLARYQMHWWKRRFNRGVNWYARKSICNDSCFVGINGTRISYADDYEVDENGVVTLYNARTYILPLTKPEEEITLFNGKYCQGFSTNANAVWYVAEDAKLLMSETSTRSSFTFLRGETYTMQPYQNLDVDAWEYLSSTQRDAYPDKAIVDDFEYEYLGVALENTIFAPRIATGSYLGTGSGGESYPSQLTFSFAPKILVLGCRGEERNGGLWVILCEKYGQSYAIWAGREHRGFGLASSVSGNTVSWYGADAIQQGNIARVVYEYVAIG